MKQVLLFSFTLLHLAFLAQTPDWQWVKNGGGVSWDQARSVGTDGAGYIYVAGLFHDSAKFGNVALIGNLSVNGPDREIFIAKYSSNGACIWAKSAGGINNDDVYSISVAQNGDLFITGEFFSTATFGSITLNGVYPNSFDIFIAKYDSSGTCLWARSGGGPSQDRALSVKGDSFGNCYITGHFRDSAFFGSNRVDNLSYYSCFIAKYNSSGNCVWAKTQINPTYAYSRGTGIATDGTAIYLTGSFSGAFFTFGNTTLNEYGNWDVFLTKLDSSGNYIWARRSGGAISSEESN